MNHVRSGRKTPACIAMITAHRDDLQCPLSAKLAQKRTVRIRHPCGHWRTLWLIVRAVGVEVEIYFQPTLAQRD